MKKLFYFIIALLFVACSKEEANDLFSEIGLETYSLESNRLLDNTLSITFPSDELLDIHYQQVEPREIGTVSFSRNQQKITVELSRNSYCDEIISGTLKEKHNGTATYDLNEGLFAGGRFILTKKDDNYEFEITIYGSGLPIIGSERGVLKTVSCSNCN